ncbi:LuxR family transcriptional regulator [Pectobacterium parmentieri]|uniref:Transcriptional activator protein ExpR n=3 Tax=Pectobacterium TaxID=122277 RepID=EXPR_PECPM|nr:LuxR family transcriptional regulator [Pectobacterium parmentieri]Q47189.1 RecName: Full=Transcriptional activator protein ExpR [Pectobacterium parmentieri]CAA56646.1 expR [Pectobacterium carotovorum]BBE36665.1 N-acylhomoserine lactone-dependent transcriptional regulator ExpR [Pectobacterium carotovorum subsp. carotovorum]ACX90120.1 transcriptional regulator, LuxR family [Pectobacterium parmentieri WPP163]AFI92652.1 Quorum-sensing transcriptional regulator [Pectobacterium parmentieri]AYH03
MSQLFYNNETISRIIKSQFDMALSHYGDIKYAYMVLNKKKPTEILIISNHHDEWREIYQANNYQHIDPVVIAALNKITPFPWDEDLLVSTQLKMSKIFNLSREHNITNGYTFVLHDHSNNLVMLSIMIDESNVSNIDDVIESNKDKLQMTLMTIHAETISLYREMIRNKEDERSNDKDIFSQRENEILYWASMGKTYQEIALILDIKTGTVKFHIGNVVKKLGVLNAKHAIRLGIELQLIRPVQS